MKKLIFDFSKCTNFEDIDATLMNYTDSIERLRHFTEKEPIQELFKQLRIESAVAISNLLEEE
jgi:hypothetical protein